MMTSSSFSTNSTSESESLLNVRSMTSCFTLSFAACSASRSACGPDPQDFASFALLSAAYYKYQRQIPRKIRLGRHIPGQQPLWDSCRHVQDCLRRAFLRHPILGQHLFSSPLLAAPSGGQDVAVSRARHRRQVYDLWRRSLHQNIRSV